MVAVVDSLITDYGLGAYIRGFEGGARPALTLTGTTVTNNRIGVYADRTGQALLTRCTVTLNDTGLFTLNGGGSPRSGRCGGWGCPAVVR